MTANDVRYLLQEPFLPLTLFLADGSVVEIARSEHASVVLTLLHIGEQHDASGWPRQTRYIDVRQIVQATQALADDDPTS